MPHVLKIDITNKHHQTPSSKRGEYVGRGSPLGNPYSHQEGTKARYKVDTREEAVEAYEKWLDAEIDAGSAPVINELTRLYEKAKKEPIALVCFCAPKSCHAEVIREKLIIAYEREQEEEANKTP